ncbi:MAG: manganese/iron ABC transporter ATP-binding protein [Phycisphaerales bacterium]|nr:manganese/iron ABC transporter ATP-binding protein [Phycisphaerales bacterium]
MALNSADRDIQVDLSVRDVTVAYNNGHVALRDATFSLSPGTICGLVGVNGSGKSTLFKAIMGFVRPVRGSVSIGPLSVREAHRRNLVAYVPQSEEVDWAFPVSVWDVVLMGRYGHMNMMRIARRADREIAMASLERVGMAEFRHRQIGELSGGQKKRVFLARALAQQGRIVLLDEPFTGVDVRTEAAIVDLLRELRAQGHIVFVSTHDLGSVPEFCDRVVIINRTVLAAGPMETTFTEQNLALAFGGALRNLRFDHTDVPGVLANELRVLTDDEAALVFDESGRPARQMMSQAADGAEATDAAEPAEQRP